MVEEIPSYGFYGLTAHNDETRAEVLALVDELLAIRPGRGGLPADGVGAEARRGSLPPPALGDSAVTPAVGSM